MEIKFSDCVIKQELYLIDNLRLYFVLQTTLDAGYVENTMDLKLLITIGIVSYFAHTPIT